MFVLIKRGPDSTESVVGIGDDRVEDAINTADDVIRDDLSDMGNTDDVEFEMITGDSMPAKFIGMWATDELYWELWDIG